MKFAFLGYGLEKNWDAMSKDELHAMVENGTAKTLRWHNGAVLVTDGPYTETKEQLGGISVLEATDIMHAVELMSKHPGIQYGATFEIRPIDEESLKRQVRSSEAASIGEDGIHHYRLKPKGS